MIPEACANGEFQLDNIVEMDEACTDGRETNKHGVKKLRTGHGTMGKVPIMGAQKRGHSIVAESVESAYHKTDTGFATAAAEVDATIHTGDVQIDSPI